MLLILMNLSLDNVRAWQPADKENFVTIITHGRGLSEKDAINDALISAIRQSSDKTYIHKEIVLKNDEIIKNELLAVSDGAVSDFKVLTTSQDAKGYFVVKAKVNVQKNKSLSNLLGNESSGNARQGKKLYGEIVSARDRLTEGKKFLEVLLRNCPNDFLEADLYGTAKLNNSDLSEQPTVGHSIKIKMNLKKYNNFSRLASEVLKKISAKNGFGAFEGRLIPESNRTLKDSFF